MYPVYIISILPYLHVYLSHMSIFGFFTCVHLSYLIFIILLSCILFSLTLPIPDITIYLSQHTYFCFISIISPYFVSTHLSFSHPRYNYLSISCPSFILYLVSCLYKTILLLSQIQLSIYLLSIIYPLSCIASLQNYSSAILDITIYLLLSAIYPLSCILSLHNILLLSQIQLSICVLSIIYPLSCILSLQNYSSAIFDITMCHSNYYSSPIYFPYCITNVSCLNFLSFLYTNIFHILSSYSHPLSIYLPI